MPRKIPANILRRLNSKNVDTSFLSVLTVTPDNETPIYLVNNDVNITYAGQEYLATHFEIVLPSDSDDSIPSTTIVFSDTQNQFLDLIRNYDQLKIKVEIVAALANGEMYLQQAMGDTTYITGDSSLYTGDASVFLSSYTGPTGYTYGSTYSIETYETKVGPYNMIMSNATGDSSTASFEISIDDVGKYNFPKGTFNVNEFSGLY